MNLSKNIRIQKVKALSTTAGSAVDSDSVDMAGWDGVLFFVTMATVNASNFVNLAQSADDSSFADLAGTKVTPGDDNDVGAIDVYRPTDRYVRMEVDRGGANTVLGEIYAIQYRGRKLPSTHGSDIDIKTHISPAEGTA